MRPVAVLDHKRDTLEAVRMMLAEVGLPAVTATIQAARRGKPDLDQLMQRHDPCVVIYGLKSPYGPAWHELMELRRTYPLFADPPFILLSANPTEARRVSEGSPWISAVLQNPFEPARLITAVERTRAAVHGARRRR